MKLVSTMHPRLSLLALTLCGFAFWTPALRAAPYLEQCASCKVKKLCQAHQQVHDKTLREAKAEMKSEDPSDRIAALKMVAALSEEHPHAPSKEAAEFLAAGMKDNSLRVRIRAVRMLVEDQHPETTVEALVDELAFFKKNMWDLSQVLVGPGEKHGTYRDAMNYLETVSESCGEVRDDRIVKALASLLGAYPSEMRGQPVCIATSQSLVRLGSKPAVKAVLRQFQGLQPGRELRAAHDVMIDLAIDWEIDTYPEYGPDVGDEWGNWFKRHGRKAPPKIGKWTGRESGD